VVCLERTRRISQSCWLAERSLSSCNVSAEMTETWAMVDRLQDVERLQTLSVNNRQHSETITTITLIQLINLLRETSKLVLLRYPKPTPRFSTVTTRWFSGSFSDWKVTISYLIKVYFCSKLSLQKELLLIIACFSVNHWMCMFAIENMDTEPHNCGHEVNNVLPASWQPNTNLLFENLP